MNPQQKFCGQCGTPLGENVRFCGECGMAIEKSQNQTAQKSSSIHNNRGQKTRKKPGKLIDIKCNFALVPLLFWASAWSAGLIISSLLILFLEGDRYFFHIFSKGIWIWLTSGLISAALLQLLKITNRNPTGKIVALIICAWIVFLLPILWMHLEGIILMLPVGALTGTCLACVIVKQISKNHTVNIQALSKQKLLGGWALCGIYAGIPYWHISLPFRGLISACLFITAFTIIMLNREK